MEINNRRKCGAKKRYDITYEKLKEMYIERKLTQKEISEEIGCSPGLISHWLVKFGVDRRPVGGVVKYVVTPDMIREMYHVQKLTAKEIAARIGCGMSVVWKHIYEMGLKLSEEEQNSRKRERNKIRFAKHRMDGSHGYLYEKRPNHPLANKIGYVSVHRINAEAVLGRSVKPEERIHHIDFNKKNNGVDNLAVLPSSAWHRKVHIYMEHIGLYHIGLGPRPEPLKFTQDVFWGGTWIRVLDLMPKEQDFISGWGAEASATVN